SDLSVGGGSGTPTVGVAMQVGSVAGLDPLLGQEATFSHCGHLAQEGLTDLAAVGDRVDATVSTFNNSGVALGDSQCRDLFRELEAQDRTPRGPPSKSEASARPRSRQPQTRHTHAPPRTRP